MDMLWQAVLNHLNSHPLALFLDALIKSLIMLALAGGLCLAWRRASAATRHLIWFLAVASLPFLPVLGTLQPSRHRSLWSVSTSETPGNEVSLTLALAPSGRTAAPVAKAAPVHADAPGVSGNQPGATPLFITRFSDNWLPLGVAVWGCGVVLGLAGLILGQFQLRKLSKAARPLTGEDWARLLREACAALRLRRRVLLLQASGSIMPLTWGWVRPVVLLPSEAGQWPEERRRIVLLHELAHIKRWDCLTQLVARTVRAFYWFNPLVWLAERRMCVERERACDDLVLSGGCRASDYASHLVDIAQSFRRVPRVAAIAMARSSGLARRIAAIVDGSRNRRLRLATGVVILLATGGVAIGLAATGAGIATITTSNASRLRQQQIARLKVFSAAKEKQAETLAAAAGEEIPPRFQRFFDAAKQGNWRTVTNMYASFKKHALWRYLRTGCWEPALEICLAYDPVINCAPTYTQLAADDIIHSIPPGSIYFGGTDAGRALPTAFCKSQIKADPFYTITQNALADPTYQEYLRDTYGERSILLRQFIHARRSDPELQVLDPEMHTARLTMDSLGGAGSDDPAFKAAQEGANKLDQRISDITQGIWSGLEAQTNATERDPAKRYIYIPTRQDSDRCLQDYIKDARVRLRTHQLKPGEHVVEESQGRVRVSGPTPIKEINGLLAKIIFDKNPDRQFYIEESFPIDWMYPYLEPHGLIFKINRQPLAQLPPAVVERDHNYWQGLVKGMIGDWLTEKTSLRDITLFALNVFRLHDLDAFKGDPQFVQNDYACKLFSKERVNIAGLYVWRMHHSADEEEAERMAQEADFAYRQALALCPYSLEAAKGYTAFLKSVNRPADAALVSDIAAQFPSAPNTASAKSDQPATEAPNAPVFAMRLVQKGPSAAAERMTYATTNQTTGRIRSETLYVQKTVLLDQTAVESATVVTNRLGGLEIDLAFTDSGRKRFANVTRQNVGRRLAIIVDGQILSAPIIQSKITNGKASIVGAFTDQEAHTLARKIDEAVAARKINEALEH